MSDRCGLVGAVDGRGASLTAEDEGEKDAIEEWDHQEYDESTQGPLGAASQVKNNKSSQEYLVR